MPENVWFLLRLLALTAVDCLRERYIHFPHSEPRMRHDARSVWLEERMVHMGR